ncbi:Subtilase family protein [Lentzea xinjiangensis]|uniref:Subtilase family protein n=1 Tax=Lentzea xinjiangensis TaxID=402600 RepID=A0A1H9WVC3_9PSEU|nr:S8 family serine peptidase [Lentzea xinjiangensis]SES37731.1 Subtilase family protein [Lentzea xinjiangensis]
MPATADAALAVGAVDRGDEVAQFSDTGPRGDRAVKPDITAPGVGIVAARARNGVEGMPVGEQHTAMSGTSMATPHVAGAAAILAQQHPDWSGARIKAALTASAESAAGFTPFQQGAGRLDVARATRQVIASTPSNVDFGVQEWPPAEDEARTRKLAYHNASAAPLVLDVRVESDAPAGLFSVSPAQVTVPAGGAAEVVVTADTRIGARDGDFPGAIVARSGDHVVRSPLGAHREVESYELTFQVTGTDGAPPSDFVTILLDLGEPATGYGFHQIGAGTPAVRLPMGDYFAATSRYADEAVAAVYHTALRVDGDRTVAVDLRRARPLSVTGPDPEAAVQGLAVTTSRPARGSTQSVTFTAADPAGLRVAGDGSTGAGARHFVEYHAAAPELVTHRYMFTGDGPLPDGFTRTVRREELAEVRRPVVGLPDGHRAPVGTFPVVPGSFGGAVYAAREVSPGDTPVDLVATDGVRWASEFDQFTADQQQVAAQVSPARSYRAGGRYEEPINQPVHGPSMPTAEVPRIVRERDELQVSVSPFADKSGGGGRTATTSQQMVLYRDGERVGVASSDTGRSLVPREAGSYRLELEATRTTPFELSTQVELVWEFRSERPAEGGCRRCRCGCRASPRSSTPRAAHPPAGCSACRWSCRSRPAPTTERCAAARSRSPSTTAGRGGASRWPVRPPPWCATRHQQGRTSPCGRTSSTTGKRVQCHRDPCLSVDRVLMSDAWSAPARTTRLGPLPVVVASIGCQAAYGRHVVGDWRFSTALSRPRCGPAARDECTSAAVAWLIT